jgi:TatD DNase family protein
MPGVFATAGMHPHTASDLDAAGESRIERLLGDPRVVAVGECGLDFFRMLSPQADQERALRFHAGLARVSGKPMVVHVRDAWDAILRVLDEERADRVVIHCFSGDESIARECAARGWFMSFAANITYPKNDGLRAAAAVVPPELLLTETDSPFLAPQRIRGRDNEPANVIDVIEELSRVRGSSEDELRVLTSLNASRAFPGLR